MTPPPPLVDWPTKKRIKAAQGWIAFHNGAEAIAELAQLAPELQSMPPIVHMRIDAHIAAKDWSTAAALATWLLKQHPEDDLQQIAGLAYYQLAECSAPTGDSEQRRIYAAAADVILDRYKSETFKDPFISELWDVVMFARCTEINARADFILLASQPESSPPKSIP